MRNTIRFVIGLGLAAALFAPARANAAPFDGSQSGAPTQLDLTTLRYGDLTGYVTASRTGSGTGNTTICVFLAKVTSLRDGGDRHDVIYGCRFDAPQGGYGFAVQSWQGFLAVAVAVDRRSFVERNGATSNVSSSRAVMRLDLRWTGTGNTTLNPTVRKTLALPPVYASLNAAKKANVTGTLGIATDRVRVNSGAGSMLIGTT